MKREPNSTAIFRAVLARKQHGNACYAGYPLVNIGMLTFVAFVVLVGTAASFNA